jgi:hypothetical protein
MAAAALVTTQSGTWKARFGVGGDDRQCDHAHRLLHVVGAVGEGDEAGGDDLQASLEDGLDLCVLYLAATRGALSARRFAVRWLERLLAERRPSLEDVGLAVGALTEFGNRNGNGTASMFTLKRLLRRPSERATGYAR